MVLKKHIQQIIITLNVDNTIIVQKNASDALNEFINQKVLFDVIFLDPPYHTDELNKSLSKINDNVGLLSDNAVIVCETEIEIDYGKYDKLMVYKTRNYGKKCVNILKLKM